MEVEEEDGTSTWAVTEVDGEWVVVDVTGILVCCM